MVWAGGLTDRFRVRVLGAVVLVMLALACVSMSTVSQAWLLPFVIFALRFAGQGMTSHISVVAMSRWFVKTRGRALSIATLGFAAGEALLPLLFVALMVQLDWRILWMFAAAVALSGIPFLLLLLTHERTPQSMAMSDQSLGMGGQHWTRHQTLRHFLFWFMVPALMGPAAFVTAFFFQQVHFAEIKGWTHVQLVALFPMYTGMSIAAMLLSGWTLDRWGTARLIPFMHLPMVLAFALFSVAPSLPVALAGLLFMAMTTGANSTLPNAFWAEFYGTRNLGSIKAMAAAVMVLGSALGPGITGVMIDAGVGLETQYLFVAAYFVGTSLLMRMGIARARASLPVAA
jgi:MFS family permease